MSTHELSAGTSINTKMLAVLSVTAFLPIVFLGISLALGAWQVWAMAAACVSIGVGSAMAFNLYSHFSRQATALNDSLSKINNGDLEARSEVVTDDEFGMVATGLNLLCDNTLNLIQSSEERDQVQNSIEKLISEMKEIAGGDLTISADVKEDITGSIAISVNHMTEQFLSIVSHVKSAAEQVNTYSSNIRDASNRMQLESDAHAGRINDASEQILEMTDSFQNAAAMTKESVQVANATRQTAANGLRAVSDTVDGMNRIRSQVQTTSKRIKRLGESSQEIGEIVQMISDISDRTSILALNASIQASMAGDAGHGFAVVAEEIERLAERSTDATHQISKLIRAVQHETGEVVSDMEESTREVVAGSQLATQAGETLFQIDNVTNQLVELIQTSSNYALQQAEDSTAIATVVSEISLSTKASTDQIRQSTQAVVLLDDMVGKLRESVSQFKVNAPKHCDGVSSPIAKLDEPQRTELSFLRSSARSASENFPTPETLKTPARIQPTTENPAVSTRQVQQTHIQETPIEAKPNLAGGSMDEELLLKKVRAEQAQIENLNEGIQGAVEKVSRTLLFESDNDSTKANESEDVAEDSFDEGLIRQLQEANSLLKQVKKESGADAKKGETGQPVQVSRTMFLTDE